MPSDLDARLRAAVEAALPDGWHVIEPNSGTLTDCDTGLRQVVLAAVAPIVEALERDRERLDWLESIACVANDIETDEPWWKIGFADSRPIEEECDLRAAIDAAMSAARTPEAGDGE